MDLHVANHRTHAQESPTSSEARAVSRTSGWATPAYPTYANANASCSEAPSRAQGLSAKLVDAAFRMIQTHAGYCPSAAVSHWEGISLGPAQTARRTHAVRSRILAATRGRPTSEFAVFPMASAAFGLASGTATNSGAACSWGRVEFATTVAQPRSRGRAACRMVPACPLVRRFATS